MESQPLSRRRQRNRLISLMFDVNIRNKMSKRSHRIKNGTTHAQAMSYGAEHQFKSLMNGMKQDSSLTRKQGSYGKGKF